MTDRHVEVLDMLLRAGRVARTMDRCETAHRFLAECLKLACSFANSSYEAWATEELAFNAMNYWPDGEGDPLEKSHQLCQAAIEQYSMLNDQISIARMLRLRALQDFQQGNGNRFLEESFDICKAHGDRVGLIETWLIMVRQKGPSSESKALLETAMKSAMELGDKELIAESLELFGVFFKSEPYVDDLFERAIHIRRSLKPSARFVRLLLTSVVFAFESDGDKRKAILHEALSVACEIGAFSLTGLCLEQLRNST